MADEDGFDKSDKDDVGELVESHGKELTKVEIAEREATDRIPPPVTHAFECIQSNSEDNDPNCECRIKYGHMMENYILCY